MATAFYYVAFAGKKIRPGVLATHSGQIAYRMLSVKLLTLNGEMNENTYHVHALITPDAPETSELRGDLRNAAFVAGHDWEHWADQVHAYYKHDPHLILDRYETLIVQLRASVAGISVESQDRLIHIGKKWGVGPSKAREFLAEMKQEPSERMAAW